MIDFNSRSLSEYLCEISAGAGCQVVLRCVSFLRLPEDSVLLHLREVRTTADTLNHSSPSSSKLDSFFHQDLFCSLN